MATITCPNRVEPSERCVCSDNPLLNLSMELSDGPRYIGFVPVPPIYQPGPGNPNEPSPPIWCQSPISEAEALICAGNQTVPTVPPTIIQPPIQTPLPEDPNPPTVPQPPSVTPPPVPPPDEPVGFWNTESNCIAFCADYSSSATAIIPANTYFGASQAEADFLASNACIALARAQLVCFTPPSEGTIVPLCAGVSANLTCVVIGLVTEINVTGLPDGMTWVETITDDTHVITISGTPTCGNSTVTVSGISANGAFSFDFYIYVLGIVCSVTPAVKGNAYTASVSGCGGIGPYVFTPTSGGGLSVDASGNITGIPTGCPSISLPVTVTDQNGETCSSTCDISVTDCDCPDWSLASAYLSGSVSTRIASADYGTFFTYAENNSQTFDCLAPAGYNQQSQCFREVTGTLVDPSHGNCSCNVHVSVVGAWGDIDPAHTLSNIRARVKIQHGSTVLVDTYYTTDQELDFPFLLTTSGSPAVPEAVNWLISSSAGPGTDDPINFCTGEIAHGGSVRVTLTFTNLAAP